MRNVYIILKNNMLRIGEKKSYLIIMAIITTITLLLGIYFTSKFEVKGHIALVMDSTVLIPIESKQLKVSVLSEMPPKSQLIMKKYDAIVTYSKNHQLKVQSLKSDDFNQKVVKVMSMLLMQVQKQNQTQSLRQTKNGTVSFSNEVERGVGSNILGYLIMFLLLQGASYMLLFSEDKEKRIIKRVLTTPTSSAVYLFSHGITNFLLILVPAFLIISAGKAFLGLEVGFGYGQYLVLLALLTILSTSLALFMSSVMKKADDSVMATSLIVVLTSILAGSFGKIGNENTIMKALINILPQKNYLTLVQGIEQGKSITEFMPQLTYYFAVCICFIIAATVITQRKFANGQD